MVLPTAVRRVGLLAFVAGTIGLIVLGIYISNELDESILTQSLEFEEAGAESAFPASHSFSKTLSGGHKFVLRVQLEDYSLINGTLAIHINGTLNETVILLARWRTNDDGVHYNASECTLYPVEFPHDTQLKLNLTLQSGYAWSISCYKNLPFEFKHCMGGPLLDVGVGILITGAIALCFAIPLTIGWWNGRKKPNPSLQEKVWKGDTAPKL